MPSAPSDTNRNGGGRWKNVVVVVKEEIDGTAVGQVEINSSPASQDYEGAERGGWSFFWLLPLFLGKS